MSKSLELALARERLLVRSAMLRDELARQSVALSPWLKAGDVGRDAVHWVRANPELVVGAVAVVVVLRPRFVWRWSLRGWSVWRFSVRWRSRLAAVMRL